MTALSASLRSIAFALGVVACAGCASEPAPHAPRVQDPPVLGFSNHDFEHDGLLTPRVAQLRQQERLEDVVRGASSELEFFERLTLWARRQFEPGVPDPYPPSNGLEILAAIRSGSTGGFCGQYSYLLADALKSFGYFDVRFVELWADEARSHFLVEVWSNSLAGWVLLDPLHAALVVDQHGTPLATWDVHEAWSGASEATVTRRWLAPADEVPRDDDAAFVELFRLPAVSLTSDLSRRDLPWTMEERRRAFLALRSDANRDLLSEQYQLQSDRRLDFLGGRNVCRIEWLDSSIRLGSLGSVAHHSGFELRIDGGEWQRVAWNAVPAETPRRVECRTVNRMDVRGVITTLEL